MLINSLAAQDQIQAVDNVRRAFANYFFFLTKGRGYIDTDLVEAPAGPISESPDLNLGLEWLISQQGPDGSWLDSDHTDVRDTGEAVNTLWDYESGVDQRQLGETWLEEAEVTTADYLSRRLTSLVHNNGASNGDLERLLAARNGNGGWGIAPGYGSDPMDTSLALSALATLQYADSGALAPSVQYATLTQRPEGGWSDTGDGASGLASTAVMVSALDHYSEAFPLDNAVQAGVQWIKGKKRSSGGYGDEAETVYSTAQALQALIGSDGSDVAGILQSSAYLFENQAPDGSWRESSYQTALALQVLRDTRTPNLKLEDIKFSPSGPKEGQQVEITATVRNNGYQAVENIRVRFYDGSWVQIGSDQIITGIGPKGNTSAQVTWDTVGKLEAQTIYAIADPDLEIKETDEEDNQAMASVNILPAPSRPDLEVVPSFISFTPDSIETIPEEILVTVRVQNLSPISVTGAALAVFDGDPKSGGTELARVTRDFAGFENRLISLPVALSDAQSRQLWVMADPENAIAEEDESNNTGSRWIYPELLPDLEILSSDFTASPDPVFVGQDVTFHALVYNHGTAEVWGAVIGFYYVNNGGLDLIGVEQVDIPAGGLAPVEYVWKTNVAGSPVEVIAQADPQNLVPELDENNNLASTSVTVDPLFEPNLTVSYQDISFSPDPAKEGSPLIISALIRNAGFAAANSVHVRFVRDSLADGPTIGAEQVIDSLEAGAEAPVAVAWDDVSERESEMIYVLVDPDNTVAEFIEDDNSAFQTVNILSLPDFLVTSGGIGFDPLFPKAGDQVRISALVTNLGEQGAENVRVRVFLGEPGPGSQIGEQVISLIPGGASGEAVFNWDSTGRQGANLIYIVANPDNVIREQSSANNTASRPINIQNADLSVTNLYISPNGDGVQDDTTLYFRLTQASEGLEVRVADWKGQAVRDLSGQIQLSDSGLEGRVVWNGLDDQGKLVDDGEYDLNLYPLGISAPVVVDTNRLPLMDAIGTDYLDVLNISQNLPAVQAYEFYPDESNVALALRFYEDPNNYSNYQDEIWAVSPDGDRANVLVPRGVIADKWVGLGPVSPDSRWIPLYTEYTAGTEGGLWIVNSRGGQPTLLMSTPEHVYVDWCRWSPLSDALACSLYDWWIGKEELWKVSLSGEKTPFYTSDPSSGWWLNDFSWSPDGTGLIYDLNNNWYQPSYQLWYARADGSLSRMLLERESEVFDVSWSPEGQRLAYQDDSIFVLDLNDPAQETNLTENWGSYNFSSLAWDGDSDEIVFLEIADTSGGGSGTGTLFVNRINSRTGAINQRLEIPIEIPFGEGGYELSQISWSPSTRYVIFYVAASSPPDEISLRNGNTQGGLWMADTKTGEVLPFISGGYSWPDPTPPKFTPLGNNVEFLGYDNQNNYGVWIVRNLQNLTASLKAKTLSKGDGFNLSGTAIDLYFNTFTLSYSSADDPDNWHLITSGSEHTFRNEDFTSWVPPAPGIYKLRLEVTDKAGNKKVKERKLYSGIQPVITDLRLEPQYFSPNGDGVQDVTVLSYKVLEPCHLEFQVYDENGALVATLLKDESQTGTSAVAWDGRDGSGQLVSDGIYFLGWGELRFKVTVDNIYPQAEISRSDAFLNKYGSWRSEISYSVSDANIDLKNSSLELRERGKSEWEPYSALKLTGQISEDPFVSAQRDYRIVARDLAGNETIRRANEMKEEIILLAWQQCLAGESGDMSCGGLAEEVPPFFRGRLDISFNHTIRREIQDIFLEYRSSDGSGEWLAGIFTVGPEGLIGRWDTTGLEKKSYQARVVAETAGGYLIPSPEFSLNYIPEDFNEEFDATEFAAGMTYCVLPAELAGAETTRINLQSSVPGILEKINQIFFLYRTNADPGWNEADITGTANAVLDYNYSNPGNPYTVIRFHGLINTGEIPDCEYETRILLITENAQRYVSDAHNISFCQIVLNRTEYVSDKLMKLEIYETFRRPLQNVLFQLGPASFSVGAFAGKTEVLLNYSQLNLGLCQSYDFKYTALDNTGYSFPNPRVLDQTCWAPKLDTACLGVQVSARALRDEPVGACNEISDFKISLTATSYHPTGPRKIEYIKAWITKAEEDDWNEIGVIENPQSQRTYDLTLDADLLETGNYRIRAETKDENGMVAHNFLIKKCDESGSCYEDFLQVFRSSPAIAYPTEGRLVCPVYTDIYSNGKVSHTLKQVSIQGSAESLGFADGYPRYGLQLKRSYEDQWEPLPYKCNPEASCFTKDNGWENGAFVFNWDFDPFIKPQDYPEYNPGNYSLRLLVADRYFNLSCDSVGFYLDSEMEMGSVFLDNKFISPINGDGHFDDATLSFTTSEDANVFFRIQDQEGNLLRNDNLGAFPGGLNQILWNGRGDDNAVVPDGKYRLVLLAQDVTCGNPKESSLEIEVDNTPPTLAFIIPEADSKVGPVAEIIGTAWDVNLREYKVEWGLGLDPTEWNPITASVVSRENGLLGVWNNDGTPGIYSIKLSASDLAGNVNEVVIPVEVIQADLISGLAADPVIFSPNGDGAKDFTTVGYSLKSQALASLQVFDAGKNPVKQILAPVSKAEGNYSAQWDGKSESGDVFPDGDYPIEFAAQQDAYKEIVTVTVKIDTVKPVIGLESPASDSCLKGGKVPFIGSVNDLHLFDYLLEYTNSPAAPAWLGIAEGNASRASFLFGNLYDLPEGDYAARLRARDEAGNESELIRNFIIDNTPPALTLTAPEAGNFFGGSKRLTVSGALVEEHLDRYTVRIGAGEEPAEWTTLAEDWIFPADGVLLDAGVVTLPDGLYTVSVLVVDRAGWEDEAKVRINIDNTPPAASISSPHSGEFVKKATDIMGTASDLNLDRFILEIAEQEEGGAAYRWMTLTEGMDSITSGILSCWEALPPDGDYQLRLTVRDLVGTEAVTSVVVAVDTHPPAAPTGLSLEKDQTNRLLRLNWNKSPEPDVVGYNVYRSVNGGTFQKLNPAPLSEPVYEDLGVRDGTYTYYVTALDRAGWESDPSQSVSAKVDFTPPQVSISVPGNGSRVNGELEIWGTAYSESDFKEYRVMVGEGIDPVAYRILRTSPLAAAYDILAVLDTRPIPSETVYTIALEAEDLSGNTAEARVTVTVDHEPPPAPVLISATPAGSNVELLWEGLPDPDIDGYLLHRDGQIIGLPTLLYSDVSPYLIHGTGYQDTGLIDGEYEYFLTAVDRAGNESLPSNLLTANLDNNVPQARITDPVTGGLVTGLIGVKAESEDQDISSVLFQDRPSGAAWSDLGSDPALPYLMDWDPTGISYGYYELRAVATDRGGRTDANPPSVTVVYDQAPLAPEGLASLTVENNVSLNWEMNDPRPDIAGFNVYRDGVKLNQPVQAAQTGTAAASSSTSSHSPNLAKDGVESTYWWSASAKTHWWSLSFPAPIPIRKIDIKWASLRQMDVNVEFLIGGQWIRLVDLPDFYDPQLSKTFDFAPYAAGFRINCALDSASNVGIYEVRVYAEVPVTGFSYADNGLPDGQYKYAVSGVDSFGLEGPMSEPANARVYAPALDQPASPVTKPEIDLTGSGVEPSALVRVYLDSGSGFNLAGSTVAGGGGGFVYENLALSPGTNAIKVQAIDALGNRSRYSGPVGVIYAIPPEPPIIVLPTHYGEPITVTTSRITVAGLAEPGSQVEVFANGSPAGVTAATVIKGGFTLSAPEGYDLDVLAPDWSPESVYIAYTCGSIDPSTGEPVEGGICILNAITQKPSPIKISGFDWFDFPSFNPAGDKIAYWGAGEIYLQDLDLQTGELGGRTQVTSIPGEKVTITRPQWTPDGENLIYDFEVVSPGHDIGIFRYEIGTGNTTRLSPEPDSGKTCFTPVISPLGGRLAYYCQDSATGELSIWAMNLDDLQGERIATLAGSPYLFPDLSWDGEGAGLYFSQVIWDEGLSRNISQVFFVDLGTGAPERVPNQPAADNFDVSFLSLGNRLVFFSSLDGVLTDMVRFGISSGRIETLIEGIGDPWEWVERGVSRQGDVAWYNPETPAIEWAWRFNFSLNDVALKPSRNEITATAENEGGAVSDQSLPIEVDYVPLAVPTGLEAALEDLFNVRLTWEYETGENTAGFNIYRSQDGKEPVLVTLEPVIVREYLDQRLANGQYIYTVTAVDLAGNESEKSEPVSIQVNNILPDAPSNLMAVPIASAEPALDLTWEHPAPGTLAGFRVYRSLVSGGPYDLVSADPVAGLAYRDAGVEFGATYYYVVTAFDGINESDPSNEASGIPADQIAPSTPVLYYPTVSGQPITLSYSQTEITGEAEPGSEVALYRQGIKVGTALAQSVAGPSQTFALSSCPNCYLGGVSADGKEVVYVDESDNEFARIYRTILSTGEKTLISPENMDSSFASWSPDAKKIALLIEDESGYNDVWIANRDGGSLTRAANTPDLDEDTAVWSPDGKRLAVHAYSTLDWSNNFWILNLEDGSLEQVTFDSDYKFQPSYYPNGELLAYFAYSSGRNNLKKLNLQTGVIITEAVNTGWYGYNISPDGLRVAFTASGTGISEIYIKEGGATTIIPSDGNQRYQPQWSPEGNTLAFLEDTGTGAYKLAYYDLASQTVSFTGPEDLSYYLDWINLGQVAVLDTQGNLELLSPAGWFRFTGVELQPGENVFTAAAQDSAGNESLQSEAIIINYDISRLADLAISEEQLLIYPPLPFAGEAVSIGVKVRNGGEASARNVVLSLFRVKPEGGLEVVDEPGIIPVLPAGGEAVLSFVWDSTGRERSQSFLALADPENRVDEVSEGNNSLVFSIKVTKDGTPVLTVDTDQDQYLSAHPVEVQVNVLNPGRPRTLIIQTRIEDAEGLLVDDLGLMTLSELGYGEEKTLTFSWNTGEVYPGDYVARALVLNGGELITEAAAAFKILPEIVINSSLTADRVSYPAEAQALFNARVECQAANQVPDTLEARLSIVSPAGAVLNTRTAPIAGLLPGTTKQVSFSWPTALNPPGSYRAELRIVGAGGAELSQSSAAFSIVSTVNISGEITVTPAKIGQGNVGAIAYQVRGQGNTGFSDGTLKIEIQDPASGALINTSESPLAISPGDTVSGQGQVDTTGFGYRNYLAVLRAVYTLSGSEVNSVIDTASFRVTDSEAPQLRVISPKEGSIAGGFIIFRAEAADNYIGTDLVEYQVDGGGWTGISLVSGTPYLGYYEAYLELSEGSHLIAARAADSEGNNWDTSASDPNPVSVQFEIDRTPPEIAITGAEEGGYYASPVNPVISVTDLHPDTVLIQVNGNPYESGTPISADGNYLLEVTAWDRAGNRSFQSLSFVVDQTPPLITISGVADGFHYQTEVIPEIEITDLSLDTSSATLNGAPFVSGTPVSAEGEYTLAAQASDKAGNTAQISVTFTIDKTVPVISVSGITDGAYYKTDVVPMITVTDSNLAGTTITLNGSPFVSGTTISEEGSYTLAVQASDKAGNTSQVAVAFTIDKTAPAISIVGITNGVYYKTDVIPEIMITELHPDVSSITLNGEPYVSGVPISMENDYVLEVQAADRAGNTSYAEVTFTIDKTPPVITVTGVTDGSYYKADVVPAITVADANLAGSTITLNGNPFIAGTIVSAEGGYTLAVEVSDKAGNTAQISVTFTIDKTPPIITIDGVTDGSYSKVDVVPTITVSDANMAVSTITLNGASFVSGTTVSSEGSYTLAVQATDKAGNTAQTTVSFKIDKTAPTITITGVTDGSYSKTDVVPVITVTDANLMGSTITLNGSPFVSGTTISAEGSNTLAVQAVDKAGNIAQTTVAFTIDKTAPVISVTGVMDGSYNKTDVVPVITVTDANLTGSTITLNGSPFVSGTTISAEGGYLLAVQATDKAGNASQATVSFTIDKTIPTVNITGVDDGACYPVAVTPTISASDAHLASVESSLNGATFVSGTTVGDEGDYALSVAALDLAGNAGQAEAAFTVDRSDPAITVTGVEDGHAYTVPVKPVIEVTDPHLAAESVSITLDGEPFVSGTTISASGDYVLAVTAQDCAGNSSQTQVNFMISISGGGLPVYNYGICAFDWIALSNNSTIRSYDFSTGLQGDEGQIAAHGNLNMLNNAAVRGSAVVGGNLVMKNNARIYGDLYIDGGSITIQNNAGISGSTTYLPVAPEPCECGYDLDGVLAAKQADNDNAVLLADPLIAPYIVDGSLVVGLNNKVTLPSGDFYFTNLYLNNNAELIIQAGATVNLFIGGNVQISNNAKIKNAPANQAELHLVCGTDSGLGEVFYFQNNAGVKAFIYAPLADVVISGNADLYGAIVGKSFTGVNNSKILLDKTLLGEGDIPPLTCE